jgi:hypothetical protein
MHCGLLLHLNLDNTETRASMDSKDNDIIRIVGIEWRMFQAVNVDGPRASCQDDPVTFFGMRAGQFLAWSDAAVKFYLQDLLSAQESGRNLIREKYIHMMEKPGQNEYASLLRTVPASPDDVVKLASDVSARLLRQSEDLARTYPNFTKGGRPLFSKDDSNSVTSLETYQKGELLTYSASTLVALKEHIDALENDGISFAEMILENTAGFYGFANLTEAEEAVKTAHYLLLTTAVSNLRES